MLASRTGKVDAMKVLLDHGAEVNAKETLRGTTALMWAAGQGHPDAVQLLIERGADLGARSNPAPRREGNGASAARPTPDPDGVAPGTREGHSRSREPPRRPDGGAGSGRTAAG